MGSWLIKDPIKLKLKNETKFKRFEEIKRTNQSLVDHLNEAKNKNNRLEYEVESLKLETENPVRENKQLRKDLDDLLNKLNEKQAMLVKIIFKPKLKFVHNSFQGLTMKLLTDKSWNSDIKSY